MSATKLSDTTTPSRLGLLASRDAEHSMYSSRVLFISVWLTLRHRQHSGSSASSSSSSCSSCLKRQFLGAVFVGSPVIVSDSQ